MAIYKIQGIERTVCGHHVYKAVWSPYVSEKSYCQHEGYSVHDDLTVAILKDSNAVGHVPRESLLVFPAGEWQQEDFTVTCIAT